MKVLIMIDSFKGSMESKTVNKIVSKQLRKKNIKSDCYSISDGGEGFLDAINFGYKKRHLKVKDALNKNIKSYYLYDKDSAYIELAKVCGLAMIKNKNPMYTSTYGVGQLIKDAVTRGYKNIYIGIGGSSTNDLGLGIIEALGAKFYHNEEELTFITGEKMGLVTRIDYSEVISKIEGLNFYCLSDVTNPLLGKNGASYTYAKQKGASKEEIEILENNAINIVNILGFSRQYHLEKSSGASGGVGYILQAIFNSKVISGINFLLNKINFENISKDYDFIITGEGKIDSQSISGKVIDGICKKTTNKVVAIVGINELFNNPYDNLKVYAITPKYASIDQSICNPKYYLKKLVKDVF